MSLVGSRRHAGAQGIRAGVPVGTTRAVIALLAAAAVTVHSMQALRAPVRIGPPPGAAPAVATPTPTPVTPPVTPAVAVAPGELARLPQATTTGRLGAGVPKDPDPYAATSGVIAHPTRTVPVYARPGGQAIASLPATQLGPTWVPVIDARPGWAQVLLPARPNRASGWITTAGGRVQLARTDYLIRVALHAHRLTLLRGRHPVGTWPISAGTPATPTPTGRTFLLGQVDETVSRYSAVILPLGEHSTALDHFGGGPATIGIHTWPDPAVYGHDRSNGCIRIPPAGLRALQRVPLGTLVITTT